MNEAQQRGALTGVKVLDLSRVLAGPYCGQMLADHGAAVTKIEPPAGDDTRTWGPPFHADGTSAYYTNLNRAKQNVVIDLSHPIGQDLVVRLLGDSDVLLENFKAGTLDRWGLTRERLEREFPRLIHCRITGFGDEGPLGGLPGYDAVLQAYSGLMSINGEADGPPLRLGVPVVDMVTGIFAFAGVLLALNERNRSGRGQLVDQSLLDTAVSLLHPHSASWLTDGTVGQRTGSAHPSIAPYETYDASDGPFFIGAGNDRQFANLVDALGIPELADDSRFLTNPDRVRNTALLRQLLQEQISRLNRSELLSMLVDKGVPASPVHDVGQTLADPQVRYRGMVVETGPYRGIGIPIKLDRSPGTIGCPPRARGFDTRQVLIDAGVSDSDIARAISAGAVYQADTTGL